jgi:hypothetical protein
MQTKSRGIISIDALISCFNLNRGELEQLEAWIYHYPDLLREVKPGYYATEPAIQAVRNVLLASRKEK